MNNLGEIVDFPCPHVNLENSFASKIPKILKACEGAKDLMIVIYLLDKKRFLYGNNAFKKILGKNYTRLLMEGWSFWFSLVDKKETSWTKDRISDFFIMPYVSKPLTLRYHLTDFYGKKRCIKHEIVLHKLEKCTFAINYFFDVSDREKIEHCFNVHHYLNGSCFSKEQTCSISTREKEVLRLISDGYSSKQIADMLCISNHTAVTHRKNLIEKFKVKNTAQLIKRASKVMEL